VTSTISTSRGHLVNTDCIELLSSIKSNTVHCIFADPPFNLRKDYGPQVSDYLPDKEYLKWTKAWLSQCIRILRPGGSLFVYNLPKWQIPVGAWLISQRRLSFRHWISISMKNVPPRGTRLYPAHYGLLYFTKGEPTVFNRDDVRVPIPTCRTCGNPIPDWGGYKNKLHPKGINLSDIWADVGQDECNACTCSDLSDVWTDTSPVRHKRYKARETGVNELDPKIPERAILMTTNPGEIVLDPFGGGGTTYRMAEKHNRYWVGSEIGACEPIREGLISMGLAIQEGPPRNLSRIFKKLLRGQELAGLRE
jgi:site-specific DNA-methyltransferase (adenine-specific)